MDDINKAISDIMADPEKLKMLQGMASSLFGENKPPPPKNDGDDIINNAKSLGALISSANLSGTKPDPSAQLLLSLKPHLSVDRQLRVDTAVKILRLIRLMPILKNSGLLNL